MAVDLKYGEVTVEKEPGNPLNGTDEPVFVIRARDKSALMIIGEYAKINSHLKDSVEDAYQAFYRWRDENPNLVKMPD